MASHHQRDGEKTEEKDSYPRLSCKETVLTFERAQLALSARVTENRFYAIDSARRDAL